MDETNLMNRLWSGVTTWSRAYDRWEIFWGCAESGDGRTVTNRDPGLGKFGGMKGLLVMAIVM